MRERAYLIYCFCVGLLGLLLSCASLEKPESLQEQMLYTQYGLVAAVEIAADLKERGRLTESEVTRFADQVTNASAALKMARTTLYADKPDEALGYVKTANAILLQLEAFLRTKQ